MRLCRRLNPFSWTRNTIIVVLLAFLSIAIPSYIIGFSAFATTINPVDASLKIPAIKLTSSVTPAIINGNEFETPERHVASYTNKNKVFLFAHSTTAFKNLPSLSLGDTIAYTKEGATNNYKITSIETLKMEDILMQKLLANTDTQTLILMTCAGQKQNGLYPERLIIYADIIE